MLRVVVLFFFFFSFFFQAEDGIRDLVRSRGLGDVYKRQLAHHGAGALVSVLSSRTRGNLEAEIAALRDATADPESLYYTWRCLLYTSDAADERSSVDLGGRRIIKKKNNHTNIVARES